MASFPPSRHLRKPHIVSIMLGLASTDATDASVSTQSGLHRSVQHPRFDLTKNKLIANIRYFENAALVGSVKVTGGCSKSQVDSSIPTPDIYQIATA